METQTHTSPLVIILAWFNYILSYIFSTPVLNKIALVLSITASIIYIYKQLKKHNDEKTNQ
jgi:hypothetical protein